MPLAIGEGGNIKLDWKRKTKAEQIKEVSVVIEDGKLPLLKFPGLDGIKGFQHCFTTRLGGVSRGIFESLNLSFTRGDDPKAVYKNFERVAESFEMTADRIVLSMQTHTTNVRKIEKSDMGSGLTKELSYRDVDGLITNEPNIILSTFYADCVPLYFVDPIKKAIGLSHSGWRGTVGRMGAVTIDKMKETFGSRPEDIHCAIGPSICKDCYEVSKDVIEQFEAEFGEVTEQFYDINPHGKYQLDLWKANEYILTEAGILSNHLEVTDICTCCNSKKLFSHRASHGKRGNLGAFLMISE